MVLPTEPGTPEGKQPMPAPPAGMEGTLGPLFKIVKDQRIAFLIVGGMNTVIGTGWFWLFDHLFRDMRAGYMVALYSAHVAAVITAFILYRRFVFRVRGHVWLDLARFEVVNLASLGVNTVALPLLVEGFGMVSIVAQLLITTVTALISFFGHKLISFRRSPAQLAAQAGQPLPEKRKDTVTDPEENS